MSDDVDAAEFHSEPRLNLIEAAEVAGLAPAELMVLIARGHGPQTTDYRDVVWVKTADLEAWLAEIGRTEPAHPTDSVDGAGNMSTRAAAEYAGLHWRKFRGIIGRGEGPPLVHPLGHCPVSQNFVVQTDFEPWLASFQKAKRDAHRIEATRPSA